MPWKELSKMDEKIGFIADWLRGEATMSALCARYGISRETGNLWRRRYLAEGAAGLEERSRAPLVHGRQTPQSVAAAIVALRRERPFWGPKKLRKVLSDREPQIAWPALSTMNDILKREGLVQPRRRRQRGLAVEQPFGAITAANDTWCIDFKGWFRTGDGVRCDPLTVSDAYSRYLLCCRIMPEQSTPVCRAVDRLFKEYGLPFRIRSDNGPPFSSNAAAGLSKLSVHWAKLGIALERIVPGQPQQNGRHERMHATLKAETARPPASTRNEQQKRFDRFRDDFNRNRPHEALSLQVPAEHYTPSPRAMPSRIPEPWYDADHQVRRVRPNGEIKWGGSLVFVSEALAGEPVGIAPTERGDWIVRFANLDLGILERRTNKMARFAAARPPHLKPNSVRDVSGP